MLLTTAIFLSGCAAIENKEGTFYNIFVKPMDWALSFFSDFFNGSYGCDYPNHSINTSHPYAANVEKL